MAKTYYDFFADPSRRDGFYAEVVENARREASVWKNCFNRFRDYLKLRCSNWPIDPSPHKSSDLPPTCPLLLSIDEVHVLYTRKKDEGSKHSLYSCLKSVLSEGTSCSFAVMCLSTANHISILAPSKEIAPSMRERAQERLLPAPFTELPFDIYLKAEPLVPGQANLDSVGTVQFTAKFGRPL